MTVPRPEQRPDDAARAVRLLAMKAVIFILVPLLAAAVAVWWRLG